jgi:hypothetical protein
MLFIGYLFGIREGDVFQKIFDEVVWLAIKHRLVADRTSTDDRYMPEHKEDRQYPGQEGRITDDPLFYTGFFTLPSRFY